MLLSIFISFILLKNTSLKEILKLKESFHNHFGIFWILKNIIVSGCILYPVKSLCNSSLFWTDIKVVESVSSENEVWTKGWPDYIRSINDNDKQKGFKRNIFKRSFWFPYWSQNHLKKILGILLPYLTFLIILILIFTQLKKA